MLMWFNLFAQCSEFNSGKRIALYKNQLLLFLIAFIQLSNRLAALLSRAIGSE